MIRNALNQSQRLLRMSSNLGNGRIDIKLQPIDSNILAVVVGAEGAAPAMHLPWKSNTGYFVDLPNSDDCILFVTAELTGCCVGVQKLENGLVRVCHYNVRNSEFDQSDFERYNSENSIRHWLVPERYEDIIADAEIYGGYSGGNDPTCFWGEKEGTEWKFYYQLPTGEIRDFSYL